jgi:uncharacterized membrane protein
MDDFSIARVVHLLAIVFWIGGVGFVTLVVFPAIRSSSPADRRLEAFHGIEGRFSWQARAWVLLAGGSGLWMVHRADLWYRFSDPAFWWMHAMVGLWLIFAVMLFVVEPLKLHGRMTNSLQPARDFDRLHRLHQALLLISVLTVAGAAAGARGLF